MKIRETLNHYCSNWSSSFYLLITEKIIYYFLQQIPKLIHCNLHQLKLCAEIRNWSRNLYTTHYTIIFGEMSPKKPNARKSVQQLRIILIKQYFSKYNLWIPCWLSNTDRMTDREMSEIYLTLSLMILVDPATEWLVPCCLCIGPASQILGIVLLLMLIDFPLRLQFLSSWPHTLASGFKNRPLQQNTDLLSGFSLLLHHPMFPSVAFVLTLLDLSLPLLRCIPRAGNSPTRTYPSLQEISSIDSLATIVLPSQRNLISWSLTDVSSKCPLSLLL